MRVMSEKLINYEKLDQCVRKFEEVVKELELDMDEWKLVLDILRDRREQQLAKSRTDDYIGGMGGGLIGSIFKKTKKEVTKNGI